jgi:hypothetical protein
VTQIIRWQYLSLRSGYLHGSVSILQNLLVRYLKYVLGVKTSTCTPAVLGELGRYPMYVNQHVRLIKYWIRLVQMDNSRLVKKAFNVLHHLNDCGFNTWATKIQNLLESHDLSYYWLNSENVSKQSFNEMLKSFKNRVHNAYLQKWQKDIYQFPILRSYVTYKNVFNMENYLCDIKDFKLRKCMAQLRLSSH